ncbi:hypothetical protein SNOG_08723 [Parastagonospora nodorum SN15]|uniref:Uncharacterized protein n=1 Tax=Phaeosphaeria nodorum (strain SN15 / ATCC MYA-4574 / FGSC 10173) TaxID=321614 RepID=Q0UHP1_PHANO|nr:hypothetical protein SNOG_08723 [Parastagonospora nodorum SN15]EAT83891.1 hypothetical protein SNOG_08723 [Parastagonospora nodorum SN15]
MTWLLPFRLFVATTSHCLTAIVELIRAPGGRQRTP